MTRVFGVGLGRTGTRSLVEAFSILGYTPCAHNPATLDELLQTRAAAEGAVLNHWAFLLAYYPQARFVYTTRDRQAWLESSRRAMARHPLSRFHDTPWLHLAIRNRIYRWGTLSYDAPRMLAHYNRHHERVMGLIPPERRLVHQATDGWPRLCAFLEREVPEQGYPRQR